VYTNSSKDGHIETASNYLYYIASIEYKNGDYDKSETSIVKAISLLDTLDNSVFKVQTRNSFYILMGLIYISEK